jgi:hypothetical protein
MAKIDSNKGQNKSNLPKPPKEKKPGKSWIAKRLDNVQRALRAATTLEERLSSMVGEARTEFRATTAKAVADAIEVRRGLRGLVEALHGLHVANYTPQSEVRGVKLATGAQVWIRAKVWTNKYVGLYQPAELDGLTIVSINGKKALAKSGSGVTVVEPTGSFTTKPQTYEVEVA